MNRMIHRRGFISHPQMRSMGQTPTVNEQGGILDVLFPKGINAGVNVSFAPAQLMGIGLAVFAGVFVANLLTKK